MSRTLLPARPSSRSHLSSSQFLHHPILPNYLAGTIKANPRSRAKGRNFAVASGKSLDTSKSIRQLTERLLRHELIEIRSSKQGFTWTRHPPPPRIIGIYKVFKLKKVAHFRESRQAARSRSRFAPQSLPRSIARATQRYARYAFVV